MTSHTPVPWMMNAEGLDIVTVADPFTEVYGIESSYRSLCDWNDPERPDVANKRFIVKAVNAHNEMVEALKATQTFFMKWSHEPFINTKEREKRISILAKVRAALSKADQVY